MGYRISTVAPRLMPLEKESTTRFRRWSVAVGVTGQAIGCCLQAFAQEPGFAR